MHVSADSPHKKLSEGMYIDILNCRIRNGHNLGNSPVLYFWVDLSNFLVNILEFVPVVLVAY